MSVNFKAINFVKETANHYLSLCQYEEKLLNWIEESNDNKMQFIADPVGITQEITGDKSLISKLEHLKKELTFPFVGLSPYKDYKLNTLKSTILQKTTEAPTADYTYGWDCVASSKIATLNKFLNLTLGWDFTISIPDNNVRGIQVVGLELGLFKVVSDDIEGGNFVTLYFPIKQGIMYDDETNVSTDLKELSFNMRVKLEKVYVNTNSSDPNKQKGKIEYYLNLESDYIDKIEVDKSMNDDLDVSSLEFYLESVLSIKYRLNLFTVDITDKDNVEELIKNYNYLVPTESYFASGNSSDEDKSCLSALIQTIAVRDSHQLMTSIDSIPDGADIGLNISNDIFFGHILIDCLTKSLNNLYSSGLTKESFSLITNNNTVVGLKTNDGVTIKIPVDNCPDIDLSHLQIMVNSTEEFEMSGDINATLAHFFDIRGSFCGKFKFVIEDTKDEDGKVVQIIKLSAIGDPVIDADCNIGVLSWIVVTFLFAGGIIGIIAGIIVLIIDKIIDSSVDKIDVDNFINTDDLLNGKLKWGFTGIGKITTVKPMACLQIGFKSRGLRDNE